MFQFSLRQQQHFDTSMELIAERQRANPDDPAPRYNIGLQMLAMNRFREGWPLLEKRLAQPGCRYSYAKFPVPRWDGQSVAGKHVLVWTENGVGDQILFASILPDLAAIAGSVTVICARRLVDLFRRSMPTIHFYKVGEPVPDRLENWAFDCQLSMHELGMMFRDSEDAFPGKPFLVADPAKTAAMDASYTAPGRRVGVSWASSSRVASDAKSVPVADLAPIFKVPGCRFFDMQYIAEDWIADEIKKCGYPLYMDPQVDQLISMDDLAAQVSVMDIVVSASSSLVHLAGALGVPTIVMLPRGKGCMWHWTSEMPYSLWYSSLTLVRQHQAGDWARPIAEAVKALEAKCPVRLAS